MAPEFATRLAQHGDAPALVIDGRPSISYAELARRAAGFGEQLGPRKCLVAIEAAASEHSVIAYLGALSAGHAVALLPASDDQALSAFQRDFAPDATYRCADGRWRLETVTEPAGDLHPDLALVMMTSGSTGQGKAVRLSFSALGANANAIASYLGLTGDDRSALVLPLHYCYGLSVLNSHFAAGGSIYLARRSVLDEGFVEALEEKKCTNLSGVPFTYDLLERIGFRERTPQHLRFMTVAGGRLAPEMVRKYDDALSRDGGQFFVMYGQTEATARMAYLPPELAARAPDRIGVPIPAGELFLRGEDGTLITEADIAGELVYRGPNVMMGYAADRSDLARGVELQELATGDLACRDAEGLFRIVGRKRRMSKIAGVRIGHDALEAALAAEGIAAVVVGNDEVVLAAYTSAQSPEEVRACLARAARLTLRHVQAVKMTALPRLASGKIDYEAISAQLEGARGDADGVAEAFRQAFFPHAVKETDSFASLAGDSLRHVEITVALERRLGHVPEGWERMTVGALTRVQPQRPSNPVIGTDLAIRVLAILLVVVQHATLWPVPGGSAAMMVLIGYGIARFQKEPLLEGDLVRFFRPLGLVLVPYYLILIGYALAWQQVPWASVFLVGNFGLANPGHHSMLPFLYWFVEAYAQTLVVLAALFAVPAIRRAAGRNAFRFGITLLLGAVAFRFIGPELWPIGGRQIFTLPWVLYLGAFGWCAALADTQARRLLVLALAACVMPLVAYDGGNWIGSWVKYGLQFVVVVALLYAPRVRLPAWLATAVLALAAASYHIYLTHRFVPELILAPIETALPAWAFTLAAISGGVALGLAAYAAQRKAIALLNASSRLRRSAGISGQSRSPATAG